MKTEPDTDRIFADIDSLQATTRWSPSAEDLARGLAAQRSVLRRSSNLSVGAFARRSHQSLYQVCRALRAGQLLSLSVGQARFRDHRIPDWQLNPLALRLTQRVRERIAALDSTLDAWTLYDHLSYPYEPLAGHSPVKEVTRHPEALERIADYVLNSLGFHL